jgi:hypothetical protein
MANTLLFSPFAKWKVHFETDLELAHKCLDEGDELTIIHCDGTLPICEPNPNNISIACKVCMARRDNGFSWLDNKSIKLIPLALDERRNIQQLNNIINSMKTIQDVENFSFENSDVGMSAVSSTVSFYREPKLIWKKHHKRLLLHLRTAILIHMRFKELLSTKNYDNIILFNGRYSTFRPVVRLAQQLNIELYVHERGPDFKHYSLARNTYPHDLKYIQNQIIKFSNDKEPEKAKKEIGKMWFEERQNHVVQNWKVFTKNQVTGYLPKNISAKSFNIAIFNSSEDEFVAIEEWKNPFYKSQNEGIRKILDSVKDENYGIFLRVHPNLFNVNNSQTQELTKIKEKYQNLTVIESDSKVNSYDLIKAVDLVITFGSTVGIEASYLNKPSIVMGNTTYLILNTCIQPINHQSMIEIIKTFRETGALPLTNDKNYLFGYYMKSYGQRFKYVLQTDLDKALLIKNGKKINLDLSLKILYIWVLRIFRKLNLLVK